jgi:hypothetical protein
MTENTQKQFETFARSVSDLCSHISVRDDENGPYIFALGLKNTHTLQLRRIGDNYVAQLWHGQSAENETIVAEPVFSTIEVAFANAREWLLKDAT